MQWNNLKEWKWAGIPYDYTKDQPLPADAGILALFCACCPQPGINLPKNWKDDPEEIVYSRNFTKDGNFTCLHQQNNKARPEIALSNGDLYMVEEKKYAAHLKVAVEMKEVRSFTRAPLILLLLTHNIFRSRPAMTTMRSTTSSSSTKVWISQALVQQPAPDMVRFCRAVL